MPASAAAMASSNQSRLKEAMTGGSGASKGPHEPDGELTDDTAGGAELRLSEGASDDEQPSSSYLEPAAGDHPSSLYGKYTWRVPNFFNTSKRELRSQSFTVGNYKFYILVYPNGCDVCNHLSLFLCVADYDKLLPGWSHFAQFTIAVVNKDPKKSKYSDTLHRFCKKEHDWGWKRFMEISKVLEGFTAEDTLMIKAQVQVIRDRPSAPFRCLDPGYRRELLRVYASNVDSICSRFVEERRTQLQVLLGQLPAFRVFWAGLPESRRAALVSERSDLVLKGIVKKFFNEKEVTSTLVMDALFSGCQQIEAAAVASPTALLAGGAAPVVADAERGVVRLQGDLLALLQGTAAQPPLPPVSDQAQEPLTARSEAAGTAGGAARDERRLAALGRRAVEVFVMSHIFLDRLATAFWEAECTRRQDALIEAEELQEAAQDARALAKATGDRERKARKKAKRKAKQAEEAAQREADQPSAAAAAAAPGTRTSAQTPSAAATTATASAAAAPKGGAGAGAGSYDGSGAHSTGTAASWQSDSERPGSSSHQIQQLRGQLAQLTAHIAEQDAELSSLRAQLAKAHAALTASTGAPPLPNGSASGKASAESISSTDSSIGSLLPANGKAHTGINGGVQAESPRSSSSVSVTEGLTSGLAHSSGGAAGTADARLSGAAEGAVNSITSDGPPAATELSRGSSGSNGSLGGDSGGSWQPAVKPRAPPKPRVSGGGASGRGGRSAGSPAVDGVSNVASARSGNAVLIVPKPAPAPAGGARGGGAATGGSGAMNGRHAGKPASLPLQARAGHTLNGNASSFVPAAAAPSQPTANGRSTFASAAGSTPRHDSGGSGGSSKCPAGAASYRAAAAAGRPSHSLPSGPPQPVAGANVPRPASAAAGGAPVTHGPTAALDGSVGDFPFLQPARSAALPPAAAAAATSGGGRAAVVARSSSTGTLGFVPGPPLAHQPDDNLVDGFAHMGLITDLLE